MSEPSLALQGAFAALLKSGGGGDLGVGDRVYDRPPSNLSFPYIRIGDDQVIGDDDDCEELSEVVTRLHVWAQGSSQPLVASKVQAKTIAGAVRSRIRAATWSLTGFTVDNVEFVQTQYLDDPDGISSHAVIEVRFLITHS